MRPSGRVPLIVAGCAVLLLAPTVAIAADEDAADASSEVRAPATTRATPDFNGDGFADLAVGAPYTRVKHRNAGATHVLYGSSDGLIARQRQVWTQASPGLGDAPRRGDQFGWALASGDFDADGFTDLAISARWESEGAWHAGVVHVLHGSPDGLTAAGSQRWSQDSPGIADQAERGDHFGTSLIAADLNGDGHDDLVVGVPMEDRGGEDAGVAHVLYGSSDGLTADGSQVWSQDSPGVSDRSEALDNFGRVLTAGDMDGDGIADLVIGVPYESRKADRIGVVHVLHGTPRGLTSARDQLWSQDSPGIRERAEERDQFGQSLAAADFNGDGFDDIAVGAWFEDQLNKLSNEGSFHIIYGSRRGLNARGNQFWHQSKPGTKDRLHISDRFGQSLAAADFDGDGLDDLAVGIPSADLGGGVHANRGAVHIFPGSRDGLTARGDRYLSQDQRSVPGRSQPWDHFGASLSAADFDADGYDELVIGIPWKDRGAKNAGAIYVMRGSDGGVTTKDGQLIGEQSSDPDRVRSNGGRFGWSMSSSGPASGTTRTADPRV